MLIVVPSTTVLANNLIFYYAIQNQSKVKCFSTFANIHHDLWIFVVSFYYTSADGNKTLLTF